MYLSINDRYHRSRLACLFSIILFFTFLTADAQKKWDGGGVDGQWTNPLNWADDQVPQAFDDILLDHSFVQGSYTVWLPAGNSAVNIKNIQVHPGLGSDSIRLVIPASNTSIPALSVGMGGIRLAERAILLNASGAPGGTAIAVADSIYILNGAMIIHNTKTAHAAYISKLSQSPGTETGLFVFDVPGTASYTVSLSGRVYGSLRLLSTASGSGRTYISTGASQAFIRGDLLIGDHVTYSLDFTGILDIRNNWEVRGLMNLASSENQNLVKVGGDITCSGTITETAAGNPVIECAGKKAQQLNITGRILNSITVRQNNAFGTGLRSTVRLPWRLELLAGRIITSDSNMLVIEPGCSVFVDSTQSASYVDGPMMVKEINTPHFLFPVGKSGNLRWIALKGALGSFVVEYIRSSPLSLSGQLDSPLAHLSSMEYWKIKSESHTSQQAELSFDNMNSGGVTDLASLRVACFSGDRWVDAGNLATTGSAGAAGSVLGDTILYSQDSWQYLTLASDVHAQNPLPSPNQSVSCRIGEGQVDFFVNIHKYSPDTKVSGCLLEKASYEGNFHKLDEVQAIPVNKGFHIRIARPELNSLYRLRVKYENKQDWVSAVMSVSGRSARAGKPNLTIHLESLRQDGAVIRLYTDQARQVTLLVMDAIGKIVMKKCLFTQAGNQSISLQFGHWPGGIYRVFGVSSSLRTNPINFFQP